MAKEKVGQLEKGAHGKARPVVGVNWSVAPNEREERIWLVRVKLQKGITCERHRIFIKKLKP